MADGQSKFLNDENKVKFLNGENKLEMNFHY